jgi:pyridoxine 5-phosphate synthase
MTQLSVNVNKIALLRNSRGGDVPGVLDFALRAIEFGAEGITVHPRPDGRHIREHDVQALREAIQVELNIEGNPTPDFIALVQNATPAQVTLVPDDPAQLTSDHGWNLEKDAEGLKPIIADFKNSGIRVSLFMDPIPENMAAAAQVGADRVELYTEAYGKDFGTAKGSATLQTYIDTAVAATESGLAINAGHDLNQANLGEFCRRVPEVLEVSIGHALVAEALIGGWENTIRSYVRILKETVA